MASATLGRFFAFLLALSKSVQFRRRLPGYVCDTGHSAASREWLEGAPMAMRVLFLAFRQLASLVGLRLALVVVAPICLCMAVESHAQASACYLHDQMPRASASFFTSKEATCADRLQIAQNPPPGSYCTWPGSVCNVYVSVQPANSTQYIYLPTAGGPMPIAAVINGQVYAVSSDHLNTPRRLTDSNGQAVWQWAYSAFGDTKPTTAHNRFADLDVTPNPGVTSFAEFLFNLRWPGQYYDTESGLHFNWNRSYDPRTGRFPQADPIGLAGGPNRFIYANLNPLRYTDSDGLAAQAIGPALPVLAVGCALTQGCRQAVSDALQSCGRGAGRIKDWLFSNGANDAAPPVPGDLVGDQSSDRAGLTKNGKRHTSGPMTPGNGGTGDASKDFDKLTGGSSQPAGGTYPPGTLVGPNGVVLRPGQKGSGPRIDIPGNGSKPPETLHY